MTAPNKQALREAAERAVSDSWGYDRDEFNDAITPEVVLAMLDELEAAQHEKDELRQGFIANQEEAHEAIKYATELKEQLARACAGREEAFREVDEMQKSLDHTHRRRAIWRGRAEEAEAKLEAAEKLNAELKEKIETADKLQDSAFRHGLQHGFSYGQTNDQAGYEQCLNSYSSRGKYNG